MPPADSREAASPATCREQRRTHSLLAGIQEMLARRAHSLLAGIQEMLARRAPKVLAGIQEMLARESGNTAGWRRWRMVHRQIFSGCWRSLRTS